jgi:hypothetical protein
MVSAVRSAGFGNTELFVPQLMRLNKRYQVRGATPRLRFLGIVRGSKADEYRDKARECEELAHATRDPFIQQQMLEVAEKWRTMAAFEEKFGR